MQATSNTFIELRTSMGNSYCNNTLRTLLVPSTDTVTPQTELFILWLYYSLRAHPIP